MNDRFKFRIYDLERKHYLRVIQDETTKAEGFAAFYGKYNNICKSLSFFLCHDVDRWVIEQCTGLKDKKGHLIFEGDILEAGGRRYVVCWAHHGFVMRFTPDSASSYPLGGTDLFEIVGNVHDTPLNDNVGEVK